MYKNNIMFPLQLAIIHSLSSSTIVTTALSGSTVIISLGGVIVREKVSFISTILSLFIETLNEAVVEPTGNITVYGPEL